MRMAIDGVQQRSGSVIDLRSMQPAKRRERPAAPPLSDRMNKPARFDGLAKPSAKKPALGGGAIVAAIEPRDVIARQQAESITRTIPWLRIGMAGLALMAAAGGFAYRFTHSSVSTVASQPQTAVSSSAASAKSAAAAPAPAGPTSAQLQSIVDQAAASAGVPVGIKVTDLSNHATASSGADSVFTSASIYKLYVADATYQALDNGSLSPGDMVGSTGMNVSSCLSAMITVSSNPCGEGLAGLIGWDDQNPQLRNAGFTHTLLRQNNSEQTSASDTALLLQRLYEGTLLSPSSTSAFVGLLKSQQINDRLPVGLPADTVIAHKTGDLNGLVHDAGIIYTPHGDYVLVALTGPWSQPGNAPAWFAKLSSQIYAAITGS